MANIAEANDNAASQAFNAPRWSAPEWAGWVVCLLIACATVHAVASIVQRLVQAGSAEALGKVISQASKPNFQIILEVTILLIGLIFALSKFPDARWLRPLIRYFRSLSERRREAILVSALVPIALRLALFPVIAVPTPKVADEFGHLLAADTFASGRLVNPPHPLWQHFETLYVLQQPHYSSIYAIGQGLVLAAAKRLTGNPWWGVCVSIGLLCGALCWMLQGWLPASLALTGALLAACRIAIASYWMNTYWGGAIAAIGGALVLGALPRALQRKKLSDVIVLCVGLTILSQSRPFEGFLLSVPVVAWIAVRWFTAKQSEERKLALRLILSMAIAGIAIAAGTGYYNYRVGKTFLFPYQEHQRVYGTPQNFRWGNEVLGAPRARVYQDISDNFEWQRDMFRKQANWRGMSKLLLDKLDSFWRFYLGASLTLPLLLGLFAKQGRVLAVTTVFTLVGIVALYPFFFPHYAAPLMGSVLVLTLFGFQRLLTMEWRGRPVGRRWAPFFVLASMAGAANGDAIWIVCSIAIPDVTPRSRVEAQLAVQPGPHVVFVHYSENHDFHKSWIYNAADVDQSKVVWARDLGEARNQEVLRYFSNRSAWLAEVDEPNTPLILYSESTKPHITSVVNAAGASPFFRAGVTPGSLVTISGNNLVRNLTQPADASYLSLTRGGVALPVLERCASAKSLPALHSIASVVRFGDMPATILAAAKSGRSQRLTVEVPSGLRGSHTDVTVTVGDEKHSVTLPLLPADPGIFQVPAGGDRLSGALLRPDDSVVSSTNPARKGETVRMLVTGLGDTTSDHVIVGVNHQGAKVVMARRAGGPAGLDLVAFRVPDNAPSGALVPLSMAVVEDGVSVYSNNSVIAVE